MTSWYTNVKENIYTEVAEMARKYAPYGLPPTSDFWFKQYNPSTFHNIYATNNNIFVPNDEIF